MEFFEDCIIDVKSNTFKFLDQEDWLLKPIPSKVRRLLDPHDSRRRTFTIPPTPLLLNMTFPVFHDDYSPTFPVTSTPMRRGRGSLERGRTFLKLSPISDPGHSPIKETQPEPSTPDIFVKPRPVRNPMTIKKSKLSEVQKPAPSNDPSLENNVLKRPLSKIPSLKPRLPFAKYQNNRISMK